MISATSSCRSTRPRRRSPYATPPSVTTARIGRRRSVRSYRGATMVTMTGDEQAAGGGGLNELDMLLGLDVQQAGTALALANAAAGLELLAALREARERSGLSEADLAERLGEDARLVLEEVVPLGADPRLSSVRRYAGAIGARLELSVDADPTGGLPG